MKKIHQDCAQCQESNFDDCGVFVRCSIDQTPAIGCLAIIPHKPVQVCSSCERETTDWDYMGPKGQRVIQCRDCMCGDWKPGYSPRACCVLALAEEKEESGKGINATKVNKHVRKKQKQQGMARVCFDGGLQR